MSKRDRPRRAGAPSARRWPRSALRAAPRAGRRSDCRRPRSRSLAGEARSLQLGVGRSMIVDLPEDAHRNLRRRSQSRQRDRPLGAPHLHLDAAPGQTTIFALGRRRPQDRRAGDHRSAATSANSTRLFKAAIPDNDIHVAHRRRLDHPDRLGRLGGRRAEGARHRLAASSPASLGGGGAGGAGAPAAAGRRQDGKVVNSLMIRGLDQVSLRVTISEIRRDIIKQLGVNYSAGRTRRRDRLGVPSLRPIRSASTARSSNDAATIGWSMAGEQLDGDAAGLRAAGRRAHARRADGDRDLRRTRQIPRRRHDPDSLGENCQAATACSSYIQQPYGVTLNFTPVVLSPGPHPAAHRHRSDRHRLLQAAHDRTTRSSPASARARTKPPSNCPRAARSSRPA